ncbi:MAG TPA: EF-P lysine aminoacylase EpmA [Steroidobacteraceae bacterium]|nr:EF-P lysine aminoacylase EpmA [Steroidobacteraceae bacterium]
MKPGEDWRPSAAPQALRARAALLARTREFFATRAALEVDTPLLVNAPVSDVHIGSAVVELAPAERGAAAHAGPRLYLHTSPEYAMKRLLAAGCGDIYQICHVVRADERGRLHNPEFTLIEWYRIGWRLETLMDEVDALVRALLGSAAPARPGERLSYREAFIRELGLDPLEAADGELRSCAARFGLEPRAAGGAGRDELLDFLMGGAVGPRLGYAALTFVHGYPARQAALARLDPQDPRTALRFELYCAGVELANGFQELQSASEQRARFERDNAARRGAGRPPVPPDERLLAALAAGMPACAGVALGFDRTLMLALGASHIDEVLPFPTARA